MSRILSGIAACVSVVILAGCTFTAHVDGPLLVSQRAAPGPVEGMAALIIGTIAFDDASGCLYLEQEGVMYPVVWPHGTEWDDATRRIGFGDNIFEIGDAVSGGGGYLQAEHVAELTSPEIGAAAARCVGETGEVAFFNVGSTVEPSAN